MGLASDQRETRCCSRCLGPVEGVPAALLSQPSSLELGVREGPQVSSALRGSRGASCVSYKGLVFRSDAKPFPGLIT